jgi:hypothetical protein
MNRLIAFLLFSLLITKNSAAQQDTALSNRLNEVLKYTQVMNIDKILDYTYPKLFTIVSREELKEIMLSSFETDDFSSTMDSIEVVTIFPTFKINDESFAKIKHSMLLRMKFKAEPDTTGGVNSMNMMTGMMESKFGAGNVRYDIPNNTIVIKLIPSLIALKEKEDAKWYFVNFDEENKEILDMLFSKEVQEKLKEYN